MDWIDPPANERSRPARRSRSVSAQRPVRPARSCQNRRLAVPRHPNLTTSALTGDLTIRRAATRIATRLGCILVILALGLGFYVLHSMILLALHK